MVHWRVPFFNPGACGFFLNLSSVLPLYPCMIPTVRLRVPFCTLQIFPCVFLFVSLHVLYELFCPKFFTFSFPVVLFPSLLYSLLPIIPFRFLSYFFPRNRTLFLSVVLLSRDSVVLFSQCLSRFPMQNIQEYRI